MGGLSRERTILHRRISSKNLIWVQADPIDQRSICTWRDRHPARCIPSGLMCLFMTPANATISRNGNDVTFDAVAFLASVGRVARKCGGAAAGDGHRHPPNFLLGGYVMCRTAASFSWGRLAFVQPLSSVHRNAQRRAKGDHGN